MHTTDGLPALFIILYLKFFDGKCSRFSHSVLHFHSIWIISMNICMIHTRVEISGEKCMNEIWVSCGLRWITQNLKSYTVCIHFSQAHCMHRFFICFDLFIIMPYFMCQLNFWISFSHLRTMKSITNCFKHSAYNTNKWASTIKSGKKIFNVWHYEIMVRTKSW